MFTSFKVVSWIPGKIFCFSALISMCTKALLIMFKMASDLNHFLDKHMSETVGADKLISMRPVPLALNLHCLVRTCLPNLYELLVEIFNRLLFGRFRFVVLDRALSGL